MRQSSSNRILVVEDEPFIRGLVVEILADAGYSTAEAACAGEALALIASSPELVDEIAVVVTDVDMPGEIDGVGLAEWLNTELPQVGVIVTSGAHTGAGLALRPPTMFLPKPFRIDRLVAAVDGMVAAMHAPQRRAS
jgi:CheY-like chemotaxis protein